VVYLMFAWVRAIRRRNARESPNVKVRHMISLSIVLIGFYLGLPRWHSCQSAGELTQLLLGTSGVTLSSRQAGIVQVLGEPVW
jgi:hypothetical protein